MKQLSIASRLSSYNLHILLLILLLTSSGNAAALSDSLIQRISVYLGDKTDFKIANRAIAVYTSCDIKHIAAEARSEYYLVRWAAAENPCTNSNIRAELALDPSDDVRQGVINSRAGNSAPAATLSRIAKSKISGLRMLAAKAKNTPEETIAILLTDTNTQVSKLAKARKN